MGSQRFEAEVHVIGKEFNTKNKTVRVHAHLIGEQPPFIRDLFAEARIWLTDQSVAALPEGAIVREGELSYVYASSGEVMGGEMAFERLLVNPGNTENGYTSVKMIDPLPEGMRIVTENAYFVYAQGMAGELVHDH